MSQLDAAIRVMEDARKEARWAGAFEEMESCQAAKTILEAAAKVEHRDPAYYMAITGFLPDDILHLLAALPDAPEKEKP